MCLIHSNKLHIHSNASHNSHASHDSHQMVMYQAAGEVLISCTAMKFGVAISDDVHVFST